MRKFYLFLFFVGLAAMVSHHATATHVRAGEIIARPDPKDQLRWTFYIYIYRDVTGIDLKDLSFYPGNLTDAITLGEEHVVVTAFPQEIYPNTEQWLYTYTHVYDAPGRYTARAVVQNRNRGVNNFGNGASDMYSFYVETQIIIDPSIDINNSPIFDNPPLERAALNRLYKHNPAATDPDGDSLSYKLVTPRYYQENPVAGSPVAELPAFKWPDDPSWNGVNEDGTGPSTFTIYSTPVSSDSIAAGDLIWDVPSAEGVVGEHNVAFQVTEWRKDRNGQYREIGYVVRDMQILVEDDPNNPPDVVTTLDTCVIAGDTLLNYVTVTDPEDDQVTLFASGGPLVTDPGDAFFEANNPQATAPDPANGLFTWYTDCEDVRRLPYEVLFTATDIPNPGVGLSDLKTLRITVLGPPPTGLFAEAVNGQIELTWDSYACTNAQSIVVYRREGSFPFERYPCEPGVPASSGYVPVATLPVGVTSYIDNDIENKGVNYCYVLVAVFPEPRGGLSIASDEVCASLDLDVPVLTKVSVDSTDAVEGVIQVQWASPQQLDSTLYPPPYRYELYRATGAQGTDFTLLYSTENLLDTTHTDEGSAANVLNTLDLAYRYRLLFYANNQLLDSSLASSVRLTITPDIESLTLTWVGLVPWNNDNQYHRIYRKNDTTQAFELIDSVLVSAGTYRYVDRGTYQNQPLETGTEYCYYVETRGTYNNPLIKPELLLNNSQEACSSPRDTVRPCPPVLTLIDTCGKCIGPGEEFPVNRGENRLTWTYPDELDGIACDSTVRAYRIYYAAQEGDSLQYLATVTAPVQEWIDPEGARPGCYEVRAVDESGNESPASNRVCSTLDCIAYELPNIFTPNGEGIHELFVPKCYTPWLIERVDFKVYNRWGKEVFASDEYLDIRWDGSGLPVGTYFYVAQVEFKQLSQGSAQRVFKGWVQIAR
ncbi:gliding motility-associated C-terminal domain-containing protein [Catalinimonas alkaloidigena]|uniref:Gliding motility-associated C-terminal domain-containing protein n=1 Tax=Catalinimonas alkaloidigena TaxID=1075417 RepID=A0A1G9PP48_9BACT|nr:gliding motility-associated C-terminal domain-containing protein [Catalinimonas alkaloidigena]SDM00007.1 gliding motility-associated C-terminal domain-containing protein [Catalinimonas alkaloidigena]